MEMNEPYDMSGAGSTSDLRGRRKSDTKGGYTKPCEWCGQSLPTVKYHLRICPQCRKDSLSDFFKKHRK
jgi:hypothetical protein